MGILKDRYKTLGPRVEYLIDPVVLSQAWKKSHTYVRRHSWYQNSLELDCSAIELEGLLADWSASIKKGAYRPSVLRLIPAPKSALWNFTPQWKPQEEDQTKRILRPLAHMEIRDQTVSTALMLCLADCIETAQGNSGIDGASAARDGRVYSYGNRLYCRWEEGEGGSRAKFSWGNTDVYSRYSEDYKRFVNRPIAIAQMLDLEGSAGPVYVVKIDLSAFFDNVEISALIKGLKREYASFRKKYRDVPASGKGFWATMASAFALRWDESDGAHVELLRDQVLPNGLPQGMVSSGFFANAYLLEFDRAIGNVVQGKRSIGAGRKIAIHDYCRYVDDIRIVVTAVDESVVEADVAEVVRKWVQDKLDKTVGSAKKLRINPGKTEVERYSSIGGSSGVVARMKNMQQELSGPFDVNTLAQVEAGLHGLLAQAELGLQAKSSDFDWSSAPLLSSVATPKLEVRDDTLTRFSAYRLTRSLRLRRSMTDLTEETDEGVAKDVLLHEFEVAARRLVAAWAVNPSLVQVLLYALDLFPSPDLLHPVTDALLSKLAPESDAYERNVAWYVLSELLRAGATETGRKAECDEGFSAGDLAEYRKKLREVATHLLQLEGAPWYVKQQASLFLSATNGATIDSNEPGLVLHLVLSDYVRGSYHDRDVGNERALSIALVGYQILRDPKHFSGWLRTYCRLATREQIARAFEVIGQTDPLLLSNITKAGKGRVAAKKGIIPPYLGQYLDSRWTSKSKLLPVGKWLPLAKVITHPGNPLAQENALLQFLRELTRLVAKPEHKPEKFTPLTIELRSKDWGRLNDPRSESLEVQYRPRRFGVDPRYSTPAWCEPKYAWLYAIGRVLRAAATGELDFTASHWVLREDIGWYHGIRSTWYKRRSGMAQSPSALGGTTAGITPWFSELLLRMLSWPGIAIDTPLVPEMDLVSSPSDLASIVESRLGAQRAIYAESSDMPVYIYPVDWTVRTPRKLRVALLQGLLPSSDDFKGGLDSLDAAGFREKHRNHLASVLQLAHRKIIARDSVLGKSHRPRVDLVIAPEYSVHVDDQDLMRQFSDSVGGMLFYGLLGAKHPSDGSFVNAARWLVPQRRGGKRSWVEVDQGKGNLTAAEVSLGVKSWRPYQAVIELSIDKDTKFRLAGAICYDATDICLAADLRDLSHMFVVAAMNKDVKTFDSMVAALRYHMYQHVLIANTGEFGGSTAQAPYDAEHSRLIAHAHGGNQLAVSIFDIEIDHFGPSLTACLEQPPPPPKAKQRPLGKTPPAGLNRK